MVEMSASRPPREEMSGQSVTRVKAEMIEASSDGEGGVVLEGTAFRRTVPGKIIGSWGMMLRFERTVEREMVLVEMESMVIVPERRSSRRKRVRINEDFPLMGMLVDLLYICEKGGGNSWDIGIERPRKI